KTRSLRLDPLRRPFLDFFHDLLQGVIFRKAKENVDVIRHRVYHDRRALPLSQNAAKVSVQVRADVVGQERLAILGAEDQVQDVLRERLRHRRAPFLAPFQGWCVWVGGRSPGRCPGLYSWTPLGSSEIASVTFVF